MMRGRVAYAGAIHEAYPDVNGVRLADGRVRREDLPLVAKVADIAMGRSFHDRVELPAFPEQTPAR